MAFAATEGAKVEAVVVVRGSALGNSFGASNVPVDAQDVVVRSGEAKTRVAFRPDGLPVSELGGCGGFKMEEYCVPPLCADKADGGGGRLAAA